MEKEILLANKSMQDIIYDIRGVRVMLDYDLATIYGVETRTLNQAVKRNMERFPQDFMFKLTEEEWFALVRKISMSSQIVMTYPEKRPKKATPYAFTEHGAVMLASVFTCTTYILAGWWRTEISVRQKVHSFEQNLPKNPSDSPEACSHTTSRIFCKLHLLSQKLHLSHRKMSLL